MDNIPAIQRAMTAPSKVDVSDKVPIHWLQKQGYCEYELFLIGVRGLSNPDPDRSDISQGRADHDALGEQHMKEAEPTDLTIPQLAQEGKRTGVCHILRDLPIVGHRMYGFIDEVEIHSYGHVYILEDKPRTKRGSPYQSSIQQAQGYALAFLQNYPKLKPVVPVIRDRVTGEWMWHRPLDQAAVYDVNEALDRIFGILDGSWTPVPTSYPGKCRACPWGQHRVCDKRQC